MKKLNLEEGIEKSIDLLKNTKAKPILIAVYGWPNSGKSFFINKLGNYFESKGLRVYKGSAGPRESTFFTIKKSLGSLRHVLIFHCGWERNKLFKDEDPNYLAEKISKRKIDLNVGIYNLNNYRGIRGNYDIIIENLIEDKK